MQSLIERAENLFKINFKCFYHTDFDKSSKTKIILGDIPQIEKYKSEKKKVYTLQKSCKNPEMRPCYEEPLLTKEQEYHLFRKFNFLKYKAKELISKLNLKKLNENKLSAIEDLLIQINEIRNEIANANFRLATFILRNEFKKFRDEKNLDGHLSDAYLDVIKSIDYFNYNLGNKFSTYAIWVVKRNFFRIAKTKRCKEEFIKVADVGVGNISTTDEFLSLEVHQKENANFINRIIDMAKNKVKTRDIERQIFIIEHYFGINGKQRKNLEEVSVMLNITKERVRQLKEKFIGYMREIIRTMDSDNVL